MSKSIWTPGKDSASYSKLRGLIPKPLRKRFKEMIDRAKETPVSAERASDPEAVARYSTAFNSGGVIVVVFTVENHDDGVYHHLTIDRENGYPSMPEIMAISSIFFGEDQAIFMTMPKPEVFFSEVNPVDVWHKERGNIILPA